MVYEDADNGEISHEEAAMLVRSFLSAGVDTTVTGIGNALWCLSQNPGEWEKLKSDPKLYRPAFEEVLRYTSPVHTFCRTAGVDTQIGSFPVAEGSKVLCVLGAANMDTEKWGGIQRFSGLIAALRVMWLSALGFTAVSVRIWLVLNSKHF